MKSQPSPKQKNLFFIFDAINEIDEQSQLELINELKKIKDTKGLRIIITYRTHTMDESMMKNVVRLLKVSTNLKVYRLNLWLSGYKGYLLPISMSIWMFYIQITRSC